MTQIAVVYFSGYGHTKLVAEKVAASAQAQLIEIDQEGNISEDVWGALKQSDAIIFGAPTYRPRSFFLELASSLAFLPSLSGVEYTPSSS